MTEKIKRVECPNCKTVFYLKVNGDTGKKKLICPYCKKEVIVEIDK